SGNTAGAGALVSTGTMTLAGGNNITLSQAGNAITISGAAGGGAGFTAGMSNIGNTSGTSGTVSNQLIMAGGNNVTLSQSTGAGGNTITVSAASQTVQTQNILNGFSVSGISTSGTLESITSGGLFIYGSFVTQSQNSISLGMASPYALSAGMSGGNTSGAGNLAVNKALYFAGGNNITLSNSNSIDGGFGVSQTITISGPAQATLERFDFPQGIFTSLGAIGQGSLSINHMYVPFNVTGTAVKIGGSLSAATNTSATTASANISLWMGIYTLNGSSLSLASSGSANNGFQWSHSASSTGNTSINSMRQMTVPMNVNMTPGQYWMAAVISSATTYTRAAYTLYGNNLINPAATAAVLTPIGSGTTANRDAMLLQGIYTAATSAGPASIGGGQINASSASNVMRANFYNVIYNATY
ncbi:MAG: hypothetical protein QG553_711, partial [Patescibacteria group bacterium]|nr:hypothetical protein [Patescibacteria group bacterium]